MSFKFATQVPQACQCCCWCKGGLEPQHLARRVHGGTRSPASTATRSRPGSLPGGSEPNGRLAGSGQAAASKHAPAPGHWHARTRGPRAGPPWKPASRASSTIVMTRMPADDLGPGPRRLGARRGGRRAAPPGPRAATVGSVPRCHCECHGARSPPRGGPSRGYSQLPWPRVHLGLPYSHY